MALIGAVGASPRLPTGGPVSGRPPDASASSQGRANERLSPPEQAAENLKTALTALERVEQTAPPGEQRVLAAEKRAAWDEANRAAASAGLFLAEGGAQSYFPRLFAERIKNAAACGRLASDGEAAKAADNYEKAERSLKVAYLSKAWEKITEAWRQMPDWSPFYHERFAHFASEWEASGRQGKNPALAFAEESASNPGEGELRMVEPARQFILWHDLCSTMADPRHYPKIFESAKGHADPFGARRQVVSMNPQIAALAAAAHQNTSQFATAMARFPGNLVHIYGRTWGFNPI